MYIQVTETTVTIPVGSVELLGDLAIPQHPHGLVMFAHGSGSSRLSPRNKQVAEYLNQQGFATLLFDLLTPEEDQNLETRFNIPLLAERLKQGTEWVQTQESCNDLHLGYFGASTGAAAALLAARHSKQIAAIVSRGGRPDLAGDALPEVHAPTLLIVGSLDAHVLQLNRQALQLLTCEKQLSIVPGATHLFEEKGAMESVCVMAANWFETHLQPAELER